MPRTLTTNRVFATKYSDLQFTVSPLSPSPIFIVVEPCMLPAGHLCRNGKPLAESVLIRSGTLLVPRRDKKYPNGIRWGVYRYGMFDALRACLHTRRGYEGPKRGEFTILRNASRMLVECIRTLAAWRSMDRAALKRLREALAALELEFSEKQAEPKMAVAARLTNAHRIKDRRGRTNPGATAARLVSAKKWVQVRLEDIRAIDPRIGLREIALINEIARVRAIFGDLWRDLRRVVPQMARDPKPGMIPVARAIIGQCIQALVTVQVGPFVALAGRAADEELGRLYDALALWQGNPSSHPLRDTVISAAKLVQTRTMTALRIAKARSVLEEIIARHFPLGTHRALMPRANIWRLFRELNRFHAKLSAVSDAPLAVQRVREVLQLLTLAREELRKGKVREAKTALRKAARKL